MGASVVVVVVVVVVTIGEKTTKVVVVDVAPGSDVLVVVEADAPATGFVDVVPLCGRVVVVVGWCRQLRLRAARCPAIGRGSAPDGFDVARMRGTQISIAAMARNARRRVRHWCATVATEKSDEEPDGRSKRMDTVRTLARSVMLASIRVVRHAAPFVESKVGQFIRYDVESNYNVTSVSCSHSRDVDSWTVNRADATWREARY